MLGGDNTVTAAFRDPSNPLQVATVIFAYEVNMGDLRYSVMTRTEIQNPKSERGSRCVCKGKKPLLDPSGGGCAGAGEGREVNGQIKV